MRRRHAPPGWVFLVTLHSLNTACGKSSIRLRRRRSLVSADYAAFRLGIGLASVLTLLGVRTLVAAIGLTLPPHPPDAAPEPGRAPSAIGDHRSVPGTGP